MFTCSCCCLHSCLLTAAVVYTLVYSQLLLCTLLFTHSCCCVHSFLLAAAVVYTLVYSQLLLCTLLFTHSCCVHSCLLTAAVVYTLVYSQLLLSTLLFTWQGADNNYKFMFMTSQLLHGAGAAPLYTLGRCIQPLVGVFNPL